MPFVFQPALASFSISGLILSQIPLESFGNPSSLEFWMWGGCVSEGVSPLCFGRGPANLEGKCELSYFWKSPEKMEARTSF